MSTDNLQQQETIAAQAQEIARLTKVCEAHNRATDSKTAVVTFGEFNGQVSMVVTMPGGDETAMVKVLGNMLALYFEVEKEVFDPLNPPYSTSQPPSPPMQVVAQNTVPRTALTSLIDAAEEAAFNLIEASFHNSHDYTEGAEALKVLVQNARDVMAGEAFPELGDWEGKSKNG